MKCACKDCTKRFIGCHATCTDYAEFRKKSENANNNRKRHKVFYNYKAIAINHIYGKGGSWVLNH